MAVYESFTYTESPIDQTNISPAKPVGTISGDDLALVLHTDWDSGAINWGTGFTERGHYFNSCTIGGATKTAGPSEPSNYPISWANSERPQASCHRISGGNGFDAASATGKTGNSTAPGTSTATASAANAIGIAIMTLDQGDIAVEDDPTKYPTGWTGAYTRTRGAGNSGVGGGAAHKTLAAGAAGDADWQAGTLTVGRTWAGFQIIFADAGVPPVGVGYTPHHIGAGIM